MCFDAAVKSMKFPCTLAIVFGLLAITANSSAGIRRVDTDRRVVALTFDDGPHPPFTEGVLAVLAEKQVKATFFLIGKQIEEHPHLARAILSAGHEVGGHSYDWDLLAFKRRSRVEDRLDKMEAAFASVGVTNLVLFRPPSGFMSPGQGAILEARRLKNIGADVVVGDWKAKTAKQIEDAVLNKVRPGSIIVLHDGGGDRAATVAALGGIIARLRNQGYSMLTVGELLDCAKE